MIYVVILYSSLLIYGHPNHNFGEQTVYKCVYLPLTSGHPSYTARIFITQGWPP